MYLHEYKQKSTFSHAYHMELKNGGNETVITKNNIANLMILFLFIQINNFLKNSPPTSLIASTYSYFSNMKENRSWVHTAIPSRPTQVIVALHHVKNTYFLLGNPEGGGGRRAPHA